MSSSMGDEIFFARFLAEEIFFSRFLAEEFSSRRFFFGLCGTV
jgi:hypothetical protein